MDAARFDRIVITLTRARTRRAVLGLLAALGLTGLLARDVAGQTCLANGQRCGGGRGACCSGRCVRKRGTNKRFCRQAPGQGICTIEADACVFTTACDEGPIGNCHCYVTARGYSFCGGTSHDCLACNTDAECETRTGGQPGDHCVQCLGVCAHTNDRACTRKCPNPT